MALDRLDLGVPVHRFGLGLAAVGRPGYINLGRGRDLPGDRSVAALRARSHELLDAAYAAGVRYVDVARSYGLAEEFFDRLAVHLVGDVEGVDVDDLAGILADGRGRSLTERAGNWLDGAGHLNAFYAGRERAAYGFLNIYRPWT